MKGLAALTSRASDEWQTPPELLERMKRYLGIEGFDLDAAATAENTVAPRFYSREDDALCNEWPQTGWAWCNPPFSRVSEFARKARRSVQNSGYLRVCMLVPARTDTAWWHEELFPFASEIWFVRGRVGFLHPSHRGRTRSPFPTVILLLDGDRGTPRLTARSLALP